MSSIGEKVSIPEVPHLQLKDFRSLEILPEKESMIPFSHNFREIDPKIRNNETNLSQETKREIIWRKNYASIFNLSSFLKKQRFEFKGTIFIPLNDSQIK